MKISDFATHGGFKLANGIVKTMYGRPINEAKVYADWIGTVEESDTLYTKDEFKKIFTDTLKQNMCSTMERKFPDLSVGEDFVEYALEYMGFSTDAKGQRILHKTYNTDIESVIHYLDGFKEEYADDSMEGGKPVRKILSQSSMISALHRYLKNKEVRMREELRERMMYHPNFASYTDAVIDYIFSKFKVTNPDISREVFKQWLWQTKRYIYSLPVVDPLFLNFFGAPHTGKTFFVQKLYEPFKEFSQKVTLSTDSRNSEQWTTNYCLFFDELPMDKSDRENTGNTMAHLKAILTSNEVTNRVMRTTKHNTSVRTASPIAATNETMTSIIYDPTGMRRFFEIVMELEGQDLSLIEDIRSLNSMNLWWGIDHNLEYGYVAPGTDSHKKMTEIQKNMKHRDIIDDPLEHGEDIPKPVKRSDELYPLLLKINSCKSVTEVRDLLTDTPYELIMGYEMRSQYREWVKSYMGDDLARWLPGNTGFLSSLRHKGYLTTSSGWPGVSSSVLCYKQQQSSKVGV